MQISELVIFITTFLIFYTYLLFPIFIILLSKIYKKPVKKNLSFEPEVTVLIAAYNEEEYIEECIRSVYNSNYPLEKISVLVGDDGSTDKTNKIIKELMHEYSSLKIIQYNRNGKNYVINKLVEEAKTNIIVFLDADYRFSNEALKNLIANFADEEVGGAFVALKMIDFEKNNNLGRVGETAYQNIDELIRDAESSISSSINTLGTYALQKKLFKYFPDKFICDDLFSCYNINKLKKRFVSDKKAVAYEVREKSFIDEQKRRIRTISGGLAALFYFKEMLLPNYGMTFINLWSHKILRYFTPFFFLIILISTFFLDTNSLLFYTLIISQGILYLSEIPALILEKKNISNIYFKTIIIFFGMNYSLILGWIYYFKKHPSSIWEHQFSE